MNERDLLVRPPNCTQFPFEDASNDKKRGLVAETYFWNTQETKKVKSRGPVPDGYRCNACKNTGHWINDCPTRQNLICRCCGEKGHTAKSCPEAPEQTKYSRALKKRDPNQCWFCLSNPNIETQLVVSILNESYIALAKGGINDQHTIIVPIGHYSSSRSLQLIPDDGSDGTEVLSEIAGIKAKIRALYEKSDKFVLSYEVFGGSAMKKMQHMHIQLIPMPMELIDLVYEKFREEAKKEQLDERYDYPNSKESPYICIEILGDKPLFFTPPSQSKLDYEMMTYGGFSMKEGHYFNISMPRYVIAGLLGKPALSDWKSCVVNSKQEVEWVSDLQTKYKEIGLISS